MKVGTKSILVGSHQFLIHPILIFIAWWKLFGFPWDIRLWICFIIHDWGYWGLSDIDGEEGLYHPVYGGHLAWNLFGKEWFDFTAYHSGSYAKVSGKERSKLFLADKYLITLDPWWLYLPRVWLSGELKELMTGITSKEYKERQYDYMEKYYSTGSPIGWYKTIQTKCRELVDREMKNVL